MRNCPVEKPYAIVPSNIAARVIRTPKAYHVRRDPSLPVSLNKNTKPLVRLAITPINRKTMSASSMTFSPL